MQIKFNFNNFARVCHSLAACQRHTPSLLTALIGRSNNDVISLRSLRCARCVCWKPGFSQIELNFAAGEHCGSTRARNYKHFLFVYKQTESIAARSWSVFGMLLRLRFYSAIYVTART